MAADRLLVKHYRGAEITLSGKLLAEVLDALVMGYCHARSFAQGTSLEYGPDHVRTKAFRKEADDMQILSGRVWDLARKAVRKRDRPYRRKA